MFPTEKQLEVRLKQSLPGIISTVLALVTGAVIIVLILLAGYLEATTRGGMDEESPAAIVLGLLLLVAIAVSFVGTVLGFAGLFQKNRRRVFPVFGALLNLFTFLSIIGLIIFGLAFG